MHGDAVLLGVLLWLFVGAGALHWGVERYSRGKERPRFGPTLLAQLLMFPVLIVWGRIAYSQSGGDLAPFSPSWNAISIIGCVLYQLTVIRLTVALEWRHIPLTLIVGTLPCLLLFKLWAATGMLEIREYQPTFKANGAMRSKEKAIWFTHDEEGHLPIPEDSTGNPVRSNSPMTRESDAVGSSTAESALFYVGPSFLPDTMGSLVNGNHSSPSDPFIDTGERRYSYGAGPIQGASAAFIISSLGPDQEDTSEQLEFLFLDKYRGDVEAFEKAGEVLDLTYSPTNGARSFGELFRASNSKTRNHTIDGDRILFP